MDYIMIGNQIRKYRKKMHMSQEELAFQIGISTTHMSHIETGSTKLSLQVLVRASDVLHISIDQLVRGDEAVDISSVFMESFPALLKCSKKEQRIAAGIVNAYLSAVDQYNR